MGQTDVDALCKLARECLQIQQLKQAKELYEKALGEDVDCADAYEGMASIAFAESDYPSAISYFSRLILLRPTETRFLTNLGAVYNRAGEHQKACDILRKAIQRDKRSAEAYYNLGIAERKLNRLQMAISAYREAARLNPKMAEAFQNLGNVYMETSNLPMAILNYKKALEINPQFRKALAGLEKAEGAANTAKESANPFGRLVNSHTKQGNANAAIMRELSDAERYEDRVRVKQFSDEIERLSKGSLEFLKVKLEPAIIELQRTMAEGASGQVDLADVADEFHAAANQWTELRKSVKRKILELRAHEEMINSPEVKL